MLYAGAFAVFSLSAVALAAPGTLDLMRFAFGDNGWAVRVNGLLDEGLVPGQDFAFTYGLLTPLVNRAVFTVFGATPAATGGLILICGLLLALAVWRLSQAAKLGIGPKLLLLILLPIVVNPGQMPSPAHALEPVFLVFALAAQAQGKLAQALAICTVGVLVKPGLGYILGLLLLVEVTVTATYRVRAILPSLAAGGLALTLLIVSFGIAPVVKTQLPIEAGKVYHDQNCGLIHGDGQHFLKPEPGTELMYFTTTPAGAWVLASGLLLAGGLAAVGKWNSDPISRTLLAMAVLHLTFALLFFGNRWGWTYYPFLPFVGAVLAVDRLPRSTPGDLGKLLAPLAGCALALLGVSVVSLYIGLGALRSWPLIEPVGRGLFARSDFAESWQEVQTLAKTGRVFVLTRAGCPGALVPGLDSPSSWYLSRAVAVPGEWDRVREKLAAAEWLVVPNWHDHNLLSWPELTEAVAGFQIAADHGAFKLYRRVGERLIQIE